MVIVIAIGFLDCNHVAVVVMLVVLDNGIFGAATRSGGFLSQIDMAPRYNLNDILGIDL
jgi:hypothetical protein